MSDEAKTVTIEVAEWHRLRRIEDAAVWCIGYLFWKASAESLAVLHRLEKATSQPTQHKRDTRSFSKRFVVVSDGIEASVHDLEGRRDLFPTLSGNRNEACDGCGFGTAQMIATALNFYEANSSREAR